MGREQLQSRTRGVPPVARLSKQSKMCQRLEESMGAHGLNPKLLRDLPQTERPIRQGYGVQAPRTEHQAPVGLGRQSR
jgi:hypothetical protein